MNDGHRCSIVRFVTVALRRGVGGRTIVFSDVVTVSLNREAEALLSSGMLHGHWDMHDINTIWRAGRVSQLDTAAMHLSSSIGCRSPPAPPSGTYIASLDQE